MTDLATSYQWLNTTFVKDMNRVWKNLNLREITYKTNFLKNKKDELERYYLL